MPPSYRLRAGVLDRLRRSERSARDPRASRMAHFRTIEPVIVSVRLHPSTTAAAVDPSSDPNPRTDGRWRPQFAPEPRLPPFTPRANLPKRARRSLEPVKTVGGFIKSAPNRELAAQRFDLTPHLGDFGRARGMLFRVRPSSPGLPNHFGRLVGRGARNTDLH